MTATNLRLWDKQYKFVTSEERDVLMQCGIGFGKTFAGAVWICLCLQKYKNCNYMIVARDVPQFKKAVLPELQSALKIFNYDEGEDYEFNRANSTFYFKEENVTIFCVGAVNYDSAFRGPNISIMWADECEFYKKEAWTAMLGRLRKSPELLRCTSTPNGFNFVSDYFEGKTVLIAPTWENRTLSAEYVENLRKSYSPKLFAQEVEAKRLLLNVGAVYNEFNRERHVKPCRHLLTEKDQLYVFLDYNISHYCATYMFKRDNMVYCIGEEHLEYKGTREMAARIKAKYPKRTVIVVGDSTGNNKRDVAIDQSNYEIFRQNGLATKHHLNPPVQSRIICANSNFYHDRIVVDPSCVTLIKDFELVSWKEGGKDIDKSNLELTHASDGATYGIHFFLPLRDVSKYKVSTNRR